MLINDSISVNQNSVIETDTINKIAASTYSKFQDGIKPTNANKAFLSIISHNIKNPFGALLGYSDLILDDYDELSDNERLIYMEEIKKSANLTYKYLERFFEWIYYKTNKVKVQITEINLNDIIAYSVEKTLLRSKFIGEMKLNIDDKIKIFADSDSIVKMFIYLIENAIKYSEPNGEISINTERDEKYAIIQIIDNGIGIPEERINRLFDISQNIFWNEKGFESGTGLGLILVQEIINMNKGSINISSKVSQGTIVTVKLPLNSVIN